ncbi:MAG TPA: glycosyltransferase [Chitinophagaceae bacterium]|nr:glycosyltransferase [Chitinophagaceae bacterium]
MDLSIIIVNYNVRYFAEQCLHSILKASKGLKAEIFLVDNRSSDGSLPYLRGLFPMVNFIENDRNKGFGAANNQAARSAKGRYLLLLNPDTLVPEDCFVHCLRFMDEHPEAGALGVRMVDGSGRFLPESKRSFPSPLVSFYKISGLAGLFPKSKIFAKYHLGHLNEFKNHPVDVLAGAFMCVRRAVWDEINGFDEAFFMYGEDIDLSYRIHQAGYINYYFAGTTILHFKGESTKKGSLNYVRMFYMAMSIFARKHLHKGQAAIFNIFIQLAIWFRAAIAAIKRIFDYVQMPLVDFFVILVCLFLVRHIWEADILPNQVYHDRILSVIPLIYITPMIFMLFFSGAYDKIIRESNIIRGVLYGTVLIMAVYGLLPGNLKYPYGMILLAGPAIMAAMLIVRRLFRYLDLGNFEYRSRLAPNTLIVGTREEAAEVKQVFQQTGIQRNLAGTVWPEAGSRGHRDYVGNVSHLTALTEIYKAGEIILCTGKLSFKDIIACMTSSGLPVSYKIHICGSHSITGGSNGSTDNHYYSLTDHFRIASPANRRNKRIMDMGFSTLVFLTLPLHALLVRKFRIFLNNTWDVFRGRKTWIGYVPGEDPFRDVLPELRPGIISPLRPLDEQEITPENRHRINQLYARQYLLWEDILNMFRLYPWMEGVQVHTNPDPDKG